MKVTDFEIADLSGNVKGDSLSEISFATINPDSLGTISGDIEIQLDSGKTAPVVLEFVKLDNRQIFVLPVTERVFKINVPAGKYFATGYIDSDADSIRGHGLAIPYRLSETATEYPDTIAVRARFETAGIKIVFR